MTAYTIEQYQALCAAIALGTKSVKYADKEVTYMSAKEMFAIKNAMETDLGLTETPTDYKPGRRIGDFSK